MYYFFTDAVMVGLAHFVTNVFVILVVNMVHVKIHGSATVTMVGEASSAIKILTTAQTTSHVAMEPLALTLDKVHILAAVHLDTLAQTVKAE